MEFQHELLIMLSLCVCVSVSVCVCECVCVCVCVPGDLFECFEDLEDPDLWQSSSEQPEQQEQSRIEVLRVADHIVPGHGPMFKVPPEYRKQMRVVMMRQECFTEYSASSSEGGAAASAVSQSSSCCIIVETD
eukprot:TRINITY_DN101592_c1_g1_i1.p2 TRINITY_DN101592_c1_g1~~TRINITY_DN101592_c1_g1_i1.p2  ORF type:complete len:133 (-),score=41.27 TRINITY_DN101592_c1_g1_i1:202-600(-)